MEVLSRFNVVFIILRDVENKPGVGAEIMKSLSSLGVEIESFQAYSLPASKYADIVVMVREENVERAVLGINATRRKVKREGPFVVADITGITIRGTGIKENSKVLEQAFSICASHNVNVVMAYTTLISLNLYVSSTDLTLEVMKALQSEFEKL